MLLMAAGGLLVVLLCVDMGIKQYIEENFEEEEEREKVDVPEFLVRKFTPSRQLIASERVIDGLDVKEICLTNGARIILKRTASKSFPPPSRAWKAKSGLTEMYTSPVTSLWTATF